MTISGSRFSGATVVDLGSTPAPTGWFVRNPGTIEAIAPPFAGTSSVVVTVTTPAGTGSTTATATVVNVAVTASAGTTPVDPAARYYHEANPPTVTSVSAANGPAGTVVTIKGTHFLESTQGVMTVDFGSVPATVTLQKSASQIKVIAPDGSGTVDVTVSDSNGTSNINEPADLFTYTP